MDNQETQKPGPSTAAAPGTPTGAAAAQLQLLQLQQQLHQQQQQQQQQSAFARFQPTGKTLPGYGIVRELPPSVPTSAAAVLSPFTFQPYTDGRFPKPEPLTSYVPGFDLAPQIMQQKPAAAPTLMQQPQQPTAAASNITPETLNVLYAFLNQMQQPPAVQPVQHLQQQSHPSALGKLLAETRGGDDSGTESMSSPGSPGSRSRSNSFSVSCLMAQAAAARRNSDILAAVAAANALTPASSRGSLASGSSGSVEALPRAATPPSGAVAQTASAATTPRVVAAASEARYAPYTPPTPTAAAVVQNPYNAAAASQQHHQLQQLHLQQQAQQQMAMQAAMQAWNNPLGYHPAFPMLMREDCVVCEDRASGYHYGVLSCEGCKGFFRRSISKNETYECMRMRNCPIKKDSRNRCQACRLAKCIARGMSKDCVRADRRKNKRKVEAEERRETNQKTVAQFAQYQLIIEQCSIAYSDAFPDGTYIMSREEALARTEKFVSAVPLLAAGGRDAAERALERVVIVRAAYSTDTCIALHPPADAVMCLQQVFSVAAGAAPLVRHPLSGRLVAVATALEIAGAADIRADRAIETLQFSLQFQLATEHASPLYNAMARILGRGPALVPDGKPEPKPVPTQ